MLYIKKMGVFYSYVYKKNRELHFVRRHIITSEIFPETYFSVRCLHR